MKAYFTCTLHFSLPVSTCQILKISLSLSIGVFVFPDTTANVYHTITQFTGHTQFFVDVVVLNLEICFKLDGLKPDGRENESIVDRQHSEKNQNPQTVRKNAC